MTPLDKTISINEQLHLFTKRYQLGRFHVNITDTFTDEDKVKLDRLLELLNKIIPTDDFENRVIHYPFKSRKAKAKYDMDGKWISEGAGIKRTAQQILAIVRNGDDGLGDSNDGTINLYLELGILDDGINGSTLRGMITMNQEYYRGTSKDQTIAATILHEYMHVCGFNHFSNRNRVRAAFGQKKDVPYGIGKCVQAVDLNEAV